MLGISKIAVIHVAGNRTEPNRTEPNWLVEFSSVPAVMVYVMFTHKGTHCTTVLVENSRVKNVRGKNQRIEVIRCWNVADTVIMHNCNILYTHHVVQQTELNKIQQTLLYIR